MGQAHQKEVPCCYGQEAETDEKGLKKGNLGDGSVGLLSFWILGRGRVPAQSQVLDLDQDQGLAQDLDQDGVQDQDQDQDLGQDGDQDLDLGLAQDLDQGGELDQDQDQDQDLDLDQDGDLDQDQDLGQTSSPLVLDLRLKQIL